MRMWTQVEAGCRRLMTISNRRARLEAGWGRDPASAGIAMA
jgi:hypothetical protein